MTTLIDSTATSPSLWLRFARWVVIVFSALSLTAVLAGAALFPTYAIRHLPEFTPNISWTFEQTQAGLRQLGWPRATIAWFELARDTVHILCNGLIGLVILWRKSRDWFGLYLAWMLVAVGMVGGPATLPLVEVLPGFSLIWELFGAASWQLFFIAFYFFPNGRAVPGWARWLALAWSVVIISSIFWPENLDFGVWVGVILVASATGSQIYRYFWRSDVLQRQQTKWVVYSAAIMLIFVSLLAAWAFEAPAGPDYGPALIQSLLFLAVFNVLFLLFPIAVGVAILRYRLWDIDLIIRRTLVYSTLTLLLGLVYVGSILLLRAVVAPLTGGSELAIVVSTLAIVALFNPLRRRIQNIIDKRFYRRKYDAAKVLAAFGTTARDETNLDALMAELVRVVDDTMQPEFVGLWLREPAVAKPTQSEAVGSQ